MRGLIALLLLIPSLAFGAFTEFYMTSGGSNLNSGSTSGAAIYTAVGDWVNATKIFTPSDGSNPVSAGVAVGMFASVYVTSGATATGYIARISAVTNATNGAITADLVPYGTNPANSSGAHTITLKVGGAWKGPGAAVTFPFGLTGTIGAMVDTSNDQVRVNAKNDQTYTMTAALPFTSLGNAVLQGYTTNVGDLGKATFTSNITSGSNFTTVAAVANPTFADLIFVNTGGSGTNHLFLDTSAAFDITMLRCVFHGARQDGFAKSNTNGRNAYLFECEAYDNNKSNTAGGGGFIVSNTLGGTMFCYNCYSHDNTGSNSAGFGTTNNSAVVLVNCISDTNGGSGVRTSLGANTNIVAINSNFYNNTGDGITLASTAASAWAVLINNNFLLNAKGVNNTVTAQGGILYNNGRGSGTQANTGADVLGSILDTSTDITYASNVTPWTAPTTGNFSTVPASAAVGAGRGNYVETDGTNTGTAAFPAIGLQAATPTATPSNTPTPTATATASFTPCAPTPTATATFTPSATFTPTPTATSTSTPTPSATATASYTPCAICSGISRARADNPQ